MIDWQDGPAGWADGPLTMVRKAEILSIAEVVNRVVIVPDVEGDSGGDLLEIVGALRPLGRFFGAG